MFSEPAIPMETFWSEDHKEVELKENVEQVETEEIQEQNEPTPAAMSGGYLPVNNPEGPKHFRKVIEF